MKKTTRTFYICIICVLLLICSCAGVGAFSISTIGMPWQKSSTITSSAQLIVFPADYAETTEIGSWLEFKVMRDGELLTYMDLTYEIVEGSDCAGVYYNGEILSFGEGEVVVKAFLDIDPSVFGYGKVMVVAPETQNKYTIFKEPLDKVATQDDTFEEQISEFPESYKQKLRALHIKYPSWIFEPVFTGIDFNDAVNIQSVGDRNLTLRVNISDTLKSRAAGDYDFETKQFINKDPGWVATNGVPVAYFIDPRNFLDERGVFQFESLLHDESFHTIKGIEGIIAGSFMAQGGISWLDENGKTLTTDTTYAQAIMVAAEETGVNPYYLAAKIRHEIGSTPSKSASGDMEGLEGFYNMYNIGATDGVGNIQRGLEWAAEEGGYNRPWTSPDRSILGGAMYIADNYVGTGQDTGYLQKWNVAPYTTSTKHLHQYMTNVSGALTLAMTAYTGYEEINMLGSPIVFSIPVYDNMPGEKERVQDEILIAQGFAVANSEVYLRTGASSIHEQTGIKLQAGERVSLKRAVKTDADYFMNWLYYPHWYEVELVREGVSYSGFVSERFVEPVASALLEIDDELDISEIFKSDGEQYQIRFLSENRNVATVSADGNITATGAGRTVVFGYTAGGAFCEFAVIVKDNNQTSNENQEEDE